VIFSVKFVCENFTEIYFEKSELVLLKNKTQNVSNPKVQKIHIKKFVKELEQTLFQIIYLKNEEVKSCK
jgi:hypothetical protein